MSTPKFVWIISPTKVEVILGANYELRRSSLTLKSFDEELIAIDQIETYGDCIVLNTTKPLDFKKNYYVTIGELSNNAYYRRDVLDEYFTYRGPLGPELKNQGKNLSLNFWSPPATQVQFVLYNKQEGLGGNRQEIIRLPLSAKDNGIWNLEFDASTVSIQDLHGHRYHLEVTCYGQKKLVLDPYAKSMEAHQLQHGINAVCGVLIDLARTNPQNYQNSYKANHQLMQTPLDFIAQEIHVRDYTISRSSKVTKKNRGTYLGFAEKVDHLVDLGITHVQFMPLQSFYTVDETNRKFQNEDVPKEQVNYNWGYDTHHYFIPSGWYSSDATNPEARIIELKTMIQTLHNNNIGAVMDVVYNHNYSRHFLEDVAPGCYLRRTREGHISTFTGAGDSLESRIKMVRRLIIDSLKYYVDEFHFNGFRFDLMGFIDLQTMREIQETLGPDIILYGEAWEFTDIPGPEATTKKQLPKDLLIGAFNDSTRNSYVGENGTRGFVQSDIGLGPLTKTGIIGAVRKYPTDYDGDGHLDVFLDEYEYHQYAYHPAQTINYLSIHDGHTLWDKLNLSTPDDLFFKQKMFKMAAAMLLTSQGRVVLESAMEMLRTKPLTANDPTPDRAHTTSYVVHEDERKYKFHENSYRSPDLTNMSDWMRLEKYPDIMKYLKGLIKLRRKFSCLRFDSSEKIHQFLRFTKEEIPNTPRFAVKEGTRHQHWNEISDLVVEFINGPFNHRMYLIGEVHGAGQKNPVPNPFYVDFDVNGVGMIHFTKEQVKNFDLGGWGDPGGLQFKLQFKEGSWDAPEEYYTKMGSNSIYPWSLNKNTNKATIDLSIKNHTAGEGDIRMNKYIAYTLDCEQNPGKILVIHNTSKQYTEVDVPEIAKYQKREILVDNLQAGIEPLKTTAVQINKTVVKVPGKSTTVIHLY